MKETDLYYPVAQLLKDQGYLIRSEVCDCDISAIKDEEHIIVELKTSVNLKLLIQATDRLTITPRVYVAVPQPARPSAHWRGTLRVLKMLELGLILVRIGQLESRAFVEFDPHVYRPRINKKKALSVLQETRERSGDYNLGGTSRQKLVTVYREKTIFMACCLEKQGPLGPRQLRELGTGDKTQSILSKNHYGWFENVSRGVYVLSEKGKQELELYPELRQKAYTLIAPT